jgi:hypothetical protein
MKLFEVPMVVTSLVGLCFLAGLIVPAAHADFTFGQPANIQSTFPLIDPAKEGIDCLSADGLEVYFESWWDRPGTYGLADLWVCKRASVEDDFGPAENLGPLVNSASWDKAAFLSTDGLELYFHSTRSGKYSQCDIYVTKRATQTSPWGQATSLGPTVNSSSNNAIPTVSPDGLELYFMSDRPGGYGSWDLYVSKRATTNDPWGDPNNVGPAVNTPGQDCAAYLSPDGLLMFFSTDRPGTFGACWDCYMARRASRPAPWQPAVSLGPIVNSAGCNAPLGVTADGSALYISRTAADYSSSTIWKAPILPIVDFNADSKVDLDDLRLLIDNWGHG